MWLRDAVFRCTVYSIKVVEGNHLLHASARRHFVRDFAGPLSIKTVLRGKVSWLLNGRRLNVRPNEMLVLNEGQPYSLDIDEVEPVETRVAFFAPGFVEAACSGLKLDEPFVTAAAGFHSRVRPLTSGIQLALQSADFVRLAVELAKEHRDWRRVPALKPTTRDELLRRVQRGRDFIEGSLHHPVSLQTAARAACLSEFHFHRLFRQIVGETPHSYVTRRRLERSVGLLTSDSSTVNEIAASCGFGKPGDFAAAFRKRYGVTPSEYRKIRKISVFPDSHERLRFQK
jgi:AraC-like DNA-binding protein